MLTPIQMKKDRVRERRDAIANGTIDDPDVPKRLEDALDFVGTCMDMCPEFERVERSVQHSVDPLELVGASRFQVKSILLITRRIPELARLIGTMLSSGFIGQQLEMTLNFLLMFGHPRYWFRHWPISFTTYAVGTSHYLKHILSYVIVLGRFGKISPCRITGKRKLFSAMR